MRKFKELEIGDTFSAFGRQARRLKKTSVTQAIDLDSSEEVEFSEEHETAWIHAPGTKGMAENFQPSEFDAIPNLTRKTSYFPLLIKYLDGEAKGMYHVVTDPSMIGCGVGFTVLAINTYVRIDGPSMKEPTSSKELKQLLLKAKGQASAFKMVDVNAVDLEAELKASKETGLQLEATIMETIRLCLGNQ